MVYTPEPLRVTGSMLNTPKKLEVGMPNTLIK